MLVFKLWRANSLYTNSGRFVRPRCTGKFRAVLRRRTGCHPASGGRRSGVEGVPQPGSMRAPAMVGPERCLLRSLFRLTALKGGGGFQGIRGVRLKLWTPARASVVLRGGALYDGWFGFLNCYCSVLVYRSIGFWSLVGTLVENVSMRPHGV